MNLHTLKVGEIFMRHMEQGSGPPVVFVHGIPTGPALWRRVFPLLPKARLLAWEMVGYANSIPEGRGRDISVGQQARYLRAWLKTMGITKPVLVGHDLGGGVAQIAALTEPNLFSGIVLTNSIGYDSWPIPSVKMLRAGRRVLKHLPPAGVKLGLSTLFYRAHESRQVARESLDLHFENYARHGAGPALAHQVQALDQRDTRAIQEKLSTLAELPARVVWGEADQFQPVRYGERLAQDLNCELMRIPGGKHFVPEDQPEVLASAIEAVIREVQQTPSEHRVNDRESERRARGGVPEAQATS